MTKARTIAFLGKSGSGKDTQAEFVADKLNPVLHVSTGTFFRKTMNANTTMGRRTKEIQDKGELMPHWFASLAWQTVLLKDLKGEENIILPSSPRNPEEAKELDTVLEWLGRDLSEAVLIDISDEEAMKRMLGRGRADDNEDEIRTRLTWFKTNVEPTIDYYEKAGRLRRVDGMASIEDVAKRISKVLEV